MKLWPFILGAWLILHGLSNLIQLNFRYESTVMAALALAAGIFVIIRK